MAAFCENSITGCDDALANERFIQWIVIQLQLTNEFLQLFAALAPFNGSRANFSGCPIALDIRNALANRL